MQLTLFYYPSCVYCQRVIKRAKELNINLRLTNIHADDEQRKRLILEGGKGQVPCLLYGVDSREEGKSTSQETWLYESLDIIKFLEERVAGQRR